MRFRCRAAVTGQRSVTWLPVLGSIKAIEDFYKISIKDIEKRVERIDERNASLKEQYGKLGEGVDLADI